MMQMPGGASALKNTDWHTWTCTIGFRVQEIWRGTEDGTDVNAVDRSHGPVDDNGDLYQVIARADDFGKVSLLKDPIVIKDQEYNEFGGHSSHVTSCRFTKKDTHLITTGGEDQCVFQWKVQANIKGQGKVEENDDEDEEDEEGEEEEGEVEAEDGGDDDDEDEEEEDDVDGANEGIQAKKVSSKKRRKKYVEEDEEEEDDPDNIFDEEEMEAGDEFMAVKPWLGAIKSPDGFEENLDVDKQKKPPMAQLQLEYCHGYRAKDCRNNLRYLKDGKVLYHAAAVGVRLDEGKNR
jgi:microtubule-associated protein-like 6